MTNDDSNNRITAIIVDTSAFAQADCDFLGVKSSRISSFFKAAKQKRILLLSHRILESEIEKHIPDSSLCKNYSSLIKELHNNKLLLERIGINYEEALNKIRDFDVQGQIMTSFHDLYKDAELLGYVEPEKVFDLYFSGKAPFSITGKKKNEFPDAFVIEALKCYVDVHINDVVMVVSNDDDWKTALCDCERIVLCDSVTKATNSINTIDSILSDEMKQMIFKGAYHDILAVAKSEADNESFDIPEYEFTYAPDIDEIEIESVDPYYNVLAESREDILIETSVHILISGRGEIIDETNSYWDPEERDYLFVSYADLLFRSGETDAECEIKLSYDFDDPEDSAAVVSIKYVDVSPITVQCNNVTITPIDDDELARRTLREDKGMSMI